MKNTAIDTENEAVQPEEIPSWFRYICDDAGNGVERYYDGYKHEPVTYWEAGHHLRLHAGEFVETEELDQLDPMDESYADFVFKWIERHFKAFLELIPEAERETTFLDGFLGIYEEHGELEE